MTLKYYNAPRQKFVSAGALGDRQIKVVASESSQDRDGDVVEAYGVDYSNYQRNPVVLWNHDPGQPLGTASVAVEGSRLLATITFAPAGASERADEVCALAKAGVVGAVSIGFQPLEKEPIRGAGWRYTRVELFEISLVSLPANAHALVVERSALSTRPRAISPAGSELRALTRAAALAPTPAHAAAANRALIEFRAREAFEAIKPDPDALRAKRLEELAALRPCP